MVEGCSGHYSKKDKASANQLYNRITKEEFEAYYTTHTIQEMCDFYAINRYVVQIVRKMFGITTFSKKPHSNKHKTGFHLYTDGSKVIRVNIGESAPDGYYRGMPKMSEDTKLKLSNSQKGKIPYNINKKMYTDGVSILFLGDEDVIPDGFELGGSKAKNKKAYHNESGETKYFFEGQQPEGWIAGGGKTKDKNAPAVAARAANIEKYKKENNCILYSEAKKAVPNGWYNNKYFISTLNVEKYGGYKYIKCSEIDKLKSYSKKEFSAFYHMLSEYEQENNCTLLHTLEQQYGQLTILRQLPKLKYKKYLFISNEYLGQIQEYKDQVKLPISNPEKELVAYIKSIYSGEILENVTNIIKNQDTGYGLELDVYIPEKNIAIEYNGVYWHSDQCKINKHYHETKSLLCSDAGIRLIHIYQDEWEDKKDKIKQLLNIALGCNNVTKIYARNCDVKQISNKEAEPFSSITHLQGHRDASVTYGLFYNDELVQLMSFSKTANAKRNGAEWEIIRGCPGSNNTVIGGVSKLFKHFINDYNPNSIFSYCDFNKFDGKSYEAIGMKFIGYTGPDKYWVIDHKLVPRSPKKYKELKEKAQGILWGSGSKKYLWEKQNENK